jgi:hypothetical protein
LTTPKNLNTIVSDNSNSKSYQSNNRKNFVKDLHLTTNNNFDDLMCDEDLTLSNSHPIYDHSIKVSEPRKSLKLLNRDKKKSESELRLSELE